jgi:hypothetical protein
VNWTQTKFSGSLLWTLWWTLHVSLQQNFVDELNNYLMLKKGLEPWSMFIFFHTSWSLFLTRALTTTLNYVYEDWLFYFFCDAIKHTVGTKKICTEMPSLLYSCETYTLRADQTRRNAILEMGCGLCTFRLETMWRNHTIT